MSIIDNALTYATSKKLEEREAAALADPTPANMSALHSILAANRPLGVAININYPTSIPSSSNIPSGYTLSKLLLRANWLHFKAAYASALHTYEDLPPTIKRLAMLDGEAVNILSTILNKDAGLLNSRKITDEQIPSYRVTYATANYYLKNVTLPGAQKGQLERAVKVAATALGSYGLWLFSVELAAAKKAAEEKAAAEEAARRAEEAARRAEAERLAKEAAEKAAAEEATRRAAEATQTVTFDLTPQEVVLPEEPQLEPTPEPTGLDSSKIAIAAGVLLVLYLLVRK